VANTSFASNGAVVLPNVTLQCQSVSGQLMLTWTAGTLQSAPTVTGTYTNIPNASSPYALVPSSPQQYFRVKVQ
jgi:hypothetical protein